ncbi:MAG: GTP 3',8-cyclase MoaA [Puniceicoccaceae bacterium]
MINKKSISLRVSLTNRCNMRCNYCRPLGQGNTRFPNGELSPDAWVERICLIRQAIPLEKVRFTGGEPLLYSAVVDVVAGCADLGIEELALTTNALRLPRYAKALKEAGLKRVNISLDSLNPETFRKINGSKLEEVLAGIEAAREAGLAIKLNTVVQRDSNFWELTELLEYAASKQLHIRFLEMMPIGPAAKDFDRLYVPGDEIREQLERIAGLEAIPYETGETSRDYRAKLENGTETLCGFILPTSTPFCDGCRRLRLDSHGRLYGCLAQPDTFPLNDAFESAGVGDLIPLKSRVATALSIKKRTQKFTEQAAMIDIGG